MKNTKGTRLLFAALLAGVAMLGVGCIVPVAHYGSHGHHRGHYDRGHHYHDHYGHHGGGGSHRYHR